MFVAKDSRIVVVEPHTFDQTRNLVALGFSGTMLTSLPQDLFQNLKALSTLTLTNNKLEVLQPSLLTPLVDLNTLDLSRNLLTSLPEDAFQGLEKLGQLMLQRNAIRKLYSNIPAGIFDDLVNLEVFRLMPGTFGPMENVFSNLTEIRLLVLSRNRIQHISPGAFNGLMELEEISLHTNRLTSIEAGIFKGLPKLANISIENNQIQHIPIQLLDGVSRLHLLELQNNSLPNLPKPFLDSLSIVDNIMVHQNPWRCDHNIIPFRDWLGQYPEKVKNITSLMCYAPPALNGRNIRELKEDDIMVSQTAAETTVDISPERDLYSVFHLLKHSTHFTET
uniref:Uncharacterized protein n=1 Tax=Cyprinus carpio TaxID=7962 RepID=A0A8C1Y6W6_CYPCA